MYKWTIWAHSPATNQWQCQLNLETTNTELTEHTAKQWADAFAQQLNTQALLQATDWYGVSKYEQVGIETLPEYQFHNPIA